MKSCLFIITVLIAISATAQEIKIESLELPYEYYTLGNGLQIVLQSDVKTDNVAIEFWIKTGSANENNDQHGLAHFFEHVTPYGLTKQKENLELFKKYKTESNAQTKKDYTRYYLELKPEGLDIGLKYSSERLKSTKEDITDEKVEHERIRVLNEIERQSSYPFWSIAGGSAIERATFGENHPYGHNVYGNLKNNQGFKLSDLQDWHSNNITPNNAILFVVGNFNIAKCKLLVDKYFSDILSKNLEPSKNNSFNNDDYALNSEVSSYINSSENYVCLVWKTAGWGSKEHNFFRLLGHIINERLKEQAKTNELILTSSTDYLSNSYKNSGQFGLYASFNELSNQKKIEKVLKRELKKIIKYGIDKNEIKRAKREEFKIIQDKQTWLGFEYSRVELLGESLLFKNNPNHYYLSLKELQKITHAELESFIGESLNNKKSKVLLISKQ